MRQKGAPVWGEAGEHSHEPPPPSVAGTPTLSATGAVSAQDQLCGAHARGTSVPGHSHDSSS